MNKTMAIDGNIDENNHFKRLQELCQSFKINITKQWLLVMIREQRMYFYERNDQNGQTLLKSDYKVTTYQITTGKKGISQIQDSEGTPLGLHKIVEKIGENAPLGTVFIGRENTEKVFTKYADWESKGYVVSRILRLKGLQEGYNSGSNCDTFNRYIYIHGISNEKKINEPSTRGCIGMLNQDIIELFSKIDLDALVLIEKE